MQLIPLKEVLAAMDSGEPFSITFCTADRKRKSGGEMLTLDNVCCKKQDTEAQKPAGAAPEGVKNPGRNPQHYKHSTRNLHIVGTEQVRKVHIRLITAFNGQKVIY